MAVFRIETGIFNTDPGFPSLLLRVCTENNERILHNIYIFQVWLINFGYILYETYDCILQYVQLFCQ